MPVRSLLTVAKVPTVYRSVFSSPITPISSPPHPTSSSPTLSSRHPNREGGAHTGKKHASGQQVSPEQWSTRGFTRPRYELRSIQASAAPRLIPPSYLVPALFMPIVCFICIFCFGFLDTDALFSAPRFQDHHVSLQFYRSFPSLIGRSKPVSPFFGN